MKINKILLAVALSCSVVSMAYADTPPDGETGAPTAKITDQGHGKITFKGSIIDAPCSIKPGNDPDGQQTVNLGAISNASLHDGGTSKPAAFTISLVNCTLDTARTVTTTFDGAAGKTGTLGMTGSAKGASIVITDGSSNIVKLGEPTAGQQISKGAQEADLVFSAYLQGDGKDVAIVPGDFQSVANFTLSYN